MHFYECPNAGDMTQAEFERALAEIGVRIAGTVCDGVVYERNGVELVLPLWYHRRTTVPYLRRRFAEYVDPAARADRIAAQERLARI